MMKTISRNPIKHFLKEPFSTGLSILGVGFVLALLLTSSHTAANELYKSFMAQPEQLSEMQAICKEMEKEQYLQSGLCEHARHAQHLMKLDDIQVKANQAWDQLENTEQFAIEY